MPKRDWATDPPKTREDAFDLALMLATQACEGARAKLGYGPHPVRTATGYDIVWPDGEITNELKIEMLQ